MKSSGDFLSNLRVPGIALTRRERPGSEKTPGNKERQQGVYQEEYDRLIAECPCDMEPVVQLACLMGMRRGGILLTC